MDPRFKPQQNPSYPQNPTYNPPQNQTGPSIYPTLPPINNPQYQPPGQHHPQNIPQNNPYGYAPLRNQGSAPNQLANAEHAANVEKMKELEKGLDTCFIKCYQVWLWLTIILCAMSGVKSFVTLISTTEQSNLPMLLASASFYCIWAIIQSIFGILAITQKNLTKATLACWMMVIYLIPSLIATIWIIVAIVEHVPDKSDDSWYLWYVGMEFFLFIFAVNTLTGIFVNLNGAFRVKNILSERNVLQEKLDRSDYSIHQA